MTTESSAQDKACQETLFKHRIDGYDLSCIAGLVDIVQSMTKRATSTLRILSDQFESGIDPYNETILQAAIEAAIFEIEDIHAIVTAYYNGVEGSKGGAA